MKNPLYKIQIGLYCISMRKSVASTIFAHWLIEKNTAQCHPIWCEAGDQRNSTRGDSAKGQGMPQKRKDTETGRVREGGRIRDSGSESKKKGKSAGCGIADKRINNINPIEIAQLWRLGARRT